MDDNAHEWQRVSYLSVGSCCGITACGSLVLYSYRREWGALFSQDPRVMEQVIEVCDAMQVIGVYASDRRLMSDSDRGL